MLSNTLPVVQLRENILALEARMNERISSGEVPSIKEDCPLKHFYATTQTKEHLYTRALFMPAGSVIVGKIHKYPCINHLMAGTLIVNTENGMVRLSAPDVFVSDAGTKRVAYIEEDVLWTTTHLTNNLDPETVEDDLTVKTFEELGLLSSVVQLQIEEK